jgi:hypothetical protein
MTHDRATGPIRPDVFGRMMAAERADGRWRLYDVGTDGKRRPAADAVVPDFVGEDALVQYLADVFHESATGRHPEERRIPD